MKNKKRIDTYKNDIYFADLVVANEYVKLEDLKKLYIYSDEVELDNFIMEGSATTSTITRKADNAPCILVKYNRPTKVKSVNKTLDLINTVSHEATHVAMDTYSFIHQNIYDTSSEPFCYLVGWASECIYKTLKNVK